MEKDISICGNNYETSQDFFNRLNTYSPDIVEHEYFTSSVAHEVVTYEDYILSKTKDDAHEDIPSSTSEDDASTNGDTLSEDIEEEFDSSATDNANGYPTYGDTTSEETKEDIDYSNLDISNGAYADFTISNHEDYFSSLFDVADDVIDCFLEYFLDI